MSKNVSKIFNKYIFILINLKIKFLKNFNLLKRSHVNENQLSFIAKSLGQIYKDGIPIKRALYLVEETVSDKYYKKSLKDVAQEISSGKSLSESFNMYSQLYPKFFTGLIFIGENTGKLYDILIQIGEYYEKSTELKKEVKAACAYPIFLLFGIVILGIVFISSIIPSFYSIYKSMGITPSGSYQMVYDFQAGFKKNYFVNITYIICWSIIVFIILRYIISRYNLNYVLKIRIVREFFEYRIVLIFSIIMSSGVSILYGLDYCIGSISPEYLNKKIIDIRKKIIEGNTLSEALNDVDILSNYSMAVIKVREETGEFEEGFKTLSLKLEKEIYKKIGNYLKALGPILISIMGVVIFIFISVFVLPLFKELQNGIRR